jgi:hypothetical protein
MNMDMGTDTDMDTDTKKTILRLCINMANWHAAGVLCNMADWHAARVLIWLTGMLLEY